MPRLTFDLGDLWADIKATIDENIMLWTEPKEAPPTVRGIKVAHFPLEDNNGNSVGTFAPEIYELACVRGLKAQQAEDLWMKTNPGATEDLKRAQPFYDALYKADGTAKTSFELAVLPVDYDDNNQASSDKVKAIIKEEFLNRIQQDQPLPPTVYKYVTKSDYLKNLHLINLKTKGPRDVTIEIQNPGDKTRIRDRVAHYLAQRASLVLTLVIVLGVTASTPAWFAVAAFGVILAEWCGKEFGTFGTAETLLRDIKSIFSREFLWGEAISLKKTIKTGVLLAAVGAVSFAAITAGWAGVMALPVWNVAATGWAASALTGLQFATAGFVSSLGALMTFVGAKDAIHFFWGLGIWDKQIDFTKETQLPALTKENELKHDLDREEHSLIADLEHKGVALTDSKKAKVHELFAQLFTTLTEKDILPEQEAPKEKANVEAASSTVVHSFEQKRQEALEQAKAQAQEKDTAKVSSRTRKNASTQ